MMTSPTWALYNHPTSIEAMHGPEWVELFPLAREAYNSAISLLRELLPQGTIRGEGLHEDPGQVGPISEQQWEHRFINFLENRLEHEQFGTRKGQPWITDVIVSLVDIRAKCGEIIAVRKRAEELSRPSPPEPCAVLEDRLRAAIKKKGAPLTYDEADEIADEIKRDGGVIMPRKERRALLITVQGRQGPGPKGPRKNRAAASA
jgi:hypothetical protein